MLSTLIANESFNIGQKAAEAGVPGAQNLADADRGLGPFISGLLGAIMVIAAILVFLNLVWGSIEWITSGGDKAKVEKARDKMTQSMIGIIVLASILALFSVVQTFLGIEVFEFPGTTKDKNDSSVMIPSQLVHQTRVLTYSLFT